MWRKVNSLADQVLVSGGNFLAVAICAHTLPLSEQGKFTYIFANYMALLLFNIAGIFQGAAVRAPAQDKLSYKAVLAKLQLLQAISLSLLVCALWFGAGDIFGWGATAIEAMLLFAFLMVQQMADFDRRAAYIFSTPKRAMLSSAMTYPVRIAALIAMQPDTVSQVMTVMIFSALIPSAISLFAVTSNEACEKKTWSAIKEHFVYSRLFIASAPLGWMWSYAPIFILGIIHGKEQVALLASIRGISNMANIFMEQIETKTAADWANAHHREGGAALAGAVTRLQRKGIIFWLAGFAVILLFGYELVELILGKTYAPHWRLLLIGWVGYGVYFIARIASIKYRIQGANQVEFIGNLCGVLAALTAGFVVIPVFSAIGAAWVYVIIAAAILIGQMYYSKKLVQV